MLKAWRKWKSTRRYAIVTLSVIIALFAGETTRRYATAEMKLAELHLDDRNEYSGAEFCAATKKYSVGQSVTRQEIVDYLHSTGITESSYQIEGRNKLRLISRKKEFPSALFTFGRSNISAIAVIEQNGTMTSAHTIEVESAPLSTFVWAVNSYGEAEKDVSFAEAISPQTESRLSVRRKLLQASDIYETPLFYAILAAEDNEFPASRGISLKHLLLASVQGRGGSGITQQVVKNCLILDGSRTLSRKLDELFLSFAVEANYEKAKIFEIYANGINFGTAADGVVLYGAASAAYEFYGVRPEEIRNLSLGKAVTLAALIKRPNFFLGMSKGDLAPPTRERIRYRELQARREYVCDQLSEHFGDVFSADEIEAARREAIDFVFASRRDETPIEKISRGFVQFAASDPALNTFAPLTKHAGVRVYLSADADLMTVSAEALNKQIAETEKNHPPVDLQTEAPAQDELLGSVIILDADNGEILSMVGTTDAGNRSPASLVKPIETYLGLSRGIITPDSTINYGSVTCRVGACLAASKNELGYYLYNRIGSGEVADFFEDLTGKRPRQQEKLAIGIGDGVGFSPMEVARAFAPLINGGYSPNVTPISKAFINGEVVQMPMQAERRHVMKDEGAATATFRLMRGALGFGEGKGTGTLRKLPFSQTAVARNLSVGAKTGSSSGDLWTVSLQKGKRNLVVVVWVGYRSGRTKFNNAGEVIAADVAGKIWSQVMMAMLKRPDLF
jgi:penicillin-binding protein 2A